MDRFKMKIDREHILSLNNKINDYNNDKRFYGLKITNENFCVADTYITELENCKNCPGLENCPNHQRGYYYIIRDNDFLLTRCEKYRQYDNINKQKSLIKSLFMPSSVYDASFNDFKVTGPERSMLYKEAVSFVEDTCNHKFHKGLFLNGAFNTGKTYLLSAIANELAKNDVTSLLIYFPDLVRQIKSSLGKPEFEELINELKSVDVLMLDDLGSENMSAWLRDEVIGPIFNYRASEHKPVCISTNLSLEQLKRHFAVDNDSLKSTRLIVRIQDTSRFLKFGNEIFK